jgi:hypothetical protein
MVCWISEDVVDRNRKAGLQGFAPGVGAFERIHTHEWHERSVLAASHCGSDFCHVSALSELDTVSLTTSPLVVFSE